ncbi:MAG TPA: 5-deoxy-glucuronate isomerase [Vicinamibacterales bacterium]|nr:5-deoxy-glucuronate isomerase [Vicinamibacterales bacterium]
MSSTELLYRSRTCSQGRTVTAIDLSPTALGWKYIHFAVRQLGLGGEWRGLSRHEERCLVLLRGAFDIEWPGGGGHVGPREDVFAGYPHAVYLPAGLRFRLTADGACEVADCRAAVSAPPQRFGLQPRIIHADECGDEIRGGGNATRQIVDIMPPIFPADRLLVCEVFTPSGNWSSYPPHKHDVDNPPREADLEEIYYFRYQDPNGYGFHRVYTDQRDDTVRVTHGDVVAVRDGYHPFVTAYGYDAYYLNVLAGNRRSMAATDDPRYAHFRSEWPAPDPRLPLVRR